MIAFISEFAAFNVDTRRKFVEIGKDEDGRK